MSDVNAEAIEAWNTILFDNFARYRHLLTFGLASHGDAVLRKHPPREGGRVLDVGCGFGDTTVQIAKLVGARGEAVGVDAAVRFIETASREAAEAPMKNVRFFAADVQDGDLGGPYDQAFSRFGTMFFQNPVAALRNVRKSLAPGGRLSIVVWRKREDNPWLYVAEQIARRFIPEREKQPDDITCGPGPFSMSGADMVSDQVQRAGFAEVSFERHDIPITIGRSIDEAIELAMVLGPAGEIVRLAKEEGEKRRPQVVAALREAFVEFEGPDGVRAPSSAWIISGRNP
jgi:ubiquinone/menaquinone biosynthesis C-methylase UbiE